MRTAPKPENFKKERLSSAHHPTPILSSFKDPIPEWELTPGWSGHASGCTTTPKTRILIADDDALVRGSLAAVLEFEGLEVDEACDGIEAVERANLHPPALVILDINMPNMDGWAAFSRLESTRPLVPVIVITARPHQYAAAVGLGVDAFMEKPLNIAALLEAVRELAGEDEKRHERRITDRGFVTRLL